MKYSAKIHAHRGASAYAPENTLPAFKLAKEMNSDGIECDIHMTKDGVIVVCHDFQLDRTSNGKGNICDYNYDELLKYDFGVCHGDKFKGTHIPLLTEMLEIVKDMDPINIEIKDLGKNTNEEFDIFYTVLKQFNCIERVIISCFDIDLIYRLKQRHPDLKTGFLFGGAEMAQKCVAFSKEHLCDAIHPYFGVMTPEIIADAHANGLIVNAWTIDDEENIRRMLDYGCDGIISNKPDLVRKILSEE